MSLTKTAKITKTMRNIQTPIFLSCVIYQKLRLARLILMQRGLRMILRLHPIRPKKGPFDRRPIDRKKVEENLLLIAKQTIPTLPLTLTGYCDDLHGFKPDSLKLWLLKLA